MKRCIFSIFTLLLAVFITTPLFALPNPAAVYCNKLGYEYKVVQTPEGEKGICVVAKGIEFDAWDFFKGKVGKEYSYCAKYGYNTETQKTEEDGYSTECAVCTATKYYRKNGKRVKKVEKTPMLELMKKNGEPLFDQDLDESDVNADSDKESEEKCDTCANNNKRINIKQRGIEKNIIKQIPSEFDLRVEGGHQYIGPVRDQGSCGSCYAFAAVAAAEGAYNYATGSRDNNRAEFSESFIMWCLSSLPAYSSHFGGCNGADYDYQELKALTTNGICPLANFPYTTTSPGSCTHWSDPLTVFSNWGRISCSDITAIKTAIMTYGAVDAGVLVSTKFQNYSRGIYKDTKVTCRTKPCYYTSTNHGIALIGWDDNPPEGGSGVWILRNSWGSSWGENGYMRIRYRAARVACEAAYLNY